MGREPWNVKSPHRSYAQMDAHKWMWDVHVRFLAVRLLAPLPSKRVQKRRRGTTRQGNRLRQDRVGVLAFFGVQNIRQKCLWPADHRQLLCRNRNPAALVSTCAIVKVSCAAAQLALPECDDWWHMHQSSFCNLATCRSSRDLVSASLQSEIRCQAVLKMALKARADVVFPWRR